RAREAAEFVVDEQAAYVILREQRIDDPADHNVVLTGHVDEIGAAVGGDHDNRVGAIGPDQAVAALRIGAGGDCSILVIGIVQRQRERALARSIATNPGGSRPSGTSAYFACAAGLVLLSFEMVEKPWSAAMTISVVAASPSSSTARRSC